MYEEITRADAATGWVLTTCGFAGGIAGAYLDDDAVQSIFGSGMPIIAGSGAPTGQAVAADSGYRLSGQWSYGSGILHATHLHTGAVILEDGKPRKNRRGNVEVYIFAPPAKAAVIKQNWDVLGLRGTASVDYDIEDVYLPAGHAFPVDQRVPKRGGNIYRTGMGALSALIHSGFALGMGRRALDELAILVQNNTGRLARLRDSESFLEGFGRAEAQYRSSRAFVFETWAEIERKIDASQDITTRDISLSPSVAQSDDVDQCRCHRLCLQRGGRRQPARWRAPALLPRHSCRYPACTGFERLPARGRPGACGDSSQPGVGADAGRAKARLILPVDAS